MKKSLITTLNNYYNSFYDDDFRENDLRTFYCSLFEEDNTFYLNNLKNEEIFDISQLFKKYDLVDEAQIILEHEIFLDKRLKYLGQHREYVGVK